MLPTLLALLPEHLHALARALDAGTAEHTSDIALWNAAKADRTPWQVVRFHTKREIAPWLAILPLMRTEAPPSWSAHTAVMDLTQYFGDAATPTICAILPRLSARSRAEVYRVLGGYWRGPCTEELAVIAILAGADESGLVRKQAEVFRRRFAAAILAALPAARERMTPEQIARLDRPAPVAPVVERTVGAALAAWKAGDIPQAAAELAAVWGVTNDSLCGAP